MACLLDMHPFLSEASVAPPRREEQDAYAISAEFYDILQGEQDGARVRQLYSRDVGNARLAVLDVGAGTGRVTLMCLVESQVPVHAVEPARSMRSPLMTRLASLPSDLRTRVTVHPHTLDEAGLHKVADVAICHNTIACLHPASRRALWPAIAGALVPGGVLLIQLPPACLPHHETTHDLPTQRVGQHEYGGRMVASADVNRIRTRFEYWVRGEGGVLREHTETFWMWPTARTEVIGELEKSGFAPLPERADPAVLAVRLTRRCPAPRSPEHARLLRLGLATALPPAPR
ncbi:class I SAM-dependent methyltransferase [Streptomyces cavernae]|uniref:class I SAM-dependent methyltransferase n=1 Tax=Streptomyces cavernae TaxID=2259034 RepID=UPI001EE3F53F|nr:class I SAM-dependent methyltransferase [Streptomyces cavernae]